MTIIGDTEAIGARRRALFPRDDAPAIVEPRINGTSTDHCEICPLPDGKSCTKSCASEREALNDGVKVW